MEAILGEIFSIPPPILGNKKSNIVIKIGVIFDLVLAVFQNDDFSKFGQNINDFFYLLTPLMMLKLETGLEKQFL